MPLQSALDASQPLFQVCNIYLRNKTFVEQSEDTYTNSMVSDKHFEHDGRCPSHLCNHLLSTISSLRTTIHITDLLTWTSALGMHCTPKRCVAVLPVALLLYASESYRQVTQMWLVPLGSVTTKWRIARITSHQEKGCM
ncbi:hypothetical protein AKAW_09453 [Aspergillus luchuensis IFO 4308]|nr:hypothetical protein AKAW_09453 [Aspergillus luchuensis IFO 4308]